ncbi:MAG: hypothetical protein P1U35_10635 [Cycloclasticus sp.]|nr:hypothetical protein [Cycloclasticus sp.]
MGKRAQKAAIQQQQIVESVETLAGLCMTVNATSISAMSGISLTTVKRKLENDPIFTPLLHKISSKVDSFSDAYNTTIMRPISSPLCKVTVNLKSEILGRFGDGTFFSCLCILIGSVVRSLGEINSSNRWNNVFSFGHDFTSVLIRVESSNQKRKGIGRRFLPLRRLREEGHFGLWFTRTGNYKSEEKCFSYTTTLHSKTIWVEAIQLFSQLSHPDCNEIPDYKVAVADLVHIKTHDVKLLLSRCVGIRGGYILMQDDCRPSASDTEDRSRVYGTIVSLGSKTRLRAGLISYDVTACFQSIAITRCDQSIESAEYRKFIANPKQYRKDLASSTGKPYPTIKRAMNAIAFGGKNTISELDVYAREAKQIGASVIAQAKLHRPEDYEYAQQLMQQKKPEGSTYEKEQNTVLFHLLAMDERRARDAMSNCFDDWPLQVHDAVYSRQDLDVSVLEKAIAQETNFNMKVTKEIKND